MKCKFLLHCFVFLFFVNKSFSQDSLATRSFTFGGSNIEFGYGGVQLSTDKGMLFNLTRNCVSGTCQHGLGVTLVTDNGRKLRSVVFGHPVHAFGVLESYRSSDGHAMIFGNSISKDGIIQKMDTNLNILWNISIPLDSTIDQSARYSGYAAEIDNQHHVLYSNQWMVYDQNGAVVRSHRYLNGFDIKNEFDLSAIQKLKANRYMLGGHIIDTSSIHSDPFIMMTNANGNIIKSKKYDVHLNYNNKVTDLFVTDANNILAIAYTRTDLLVMAVDSSLNLKWAKKYTGGSFGNPAVSRVNSDCFVIAAYNRSQETSILAIDKMGNLLWSKKVANGHAAYKANLYNTDTCHVALYTTEALNTTGTRGRGLWIKMDAQGNHSSSFVSNHTITATSLNLPAYTPKIIDAGAVIMTPFSVNFTTVATPVVLAGLASQSPSNATCSYYNPPPPVSISDYKLSSHISVYPNPAVNEITISFEEQHYQNAEFVIFDLQGKSFGRYNLDGEKMRISINDLPKGLYLYQLIVSDQLIQVGKIVKR